MTQYPAHTRRAVVAVLVGALWVWSSAAVRAGADPPAWLDVINAYRASAGLAPVAENPAWTRPVALHARYVAITETAWHDEDPASPYYSADGAAAARRSLIAGWWGAHRSERDLVEMWMAAPFHLVHLLEPGLRQVAMAVVQEDSPRPASAGVVDVFQGLDRTVRAATAVVFPGAGSTVPLTTFAGETPDPLTACPGYVAPAGLPVVALLPTAPGDVRTALSAGGQAVEHCTVTAATYVNPDANAQNLVRSILHQKNVVVLLPRQPLSSASTYTATITSGGQKASWSFTTVAGGAIPSAMPTLLPTTVPQAAKVPAPRLTTMSGAGLRPVVTVVRPSATVVVPSTVVEKQRLSTPRTVARTARAAPSKAARPPARTA